MEFDPQKFFIGIIDFFSVLLPGAILTAVLIGVGLMGYKPENATDWMIFFVVSYVLGHFLFLIGSVFDDKVYEPLRRLTDRRQVSLLLKSQPLSPWFPRWIAKKLFKIRPDAAVTRVEYIKKQYLRKIGDPKSVNAFQWCKARLALEHPEAVTIVNRFEADSKFFRSFVPVIMGLFIVTLCLAALSPSKLKFWGGSFALMILSLMAFWRYMEQRFKATQQAYWFVLTLEADKLARTSNQEPPVDPGKTEARKDGVTHAGGVVVRQCGKSREYLLVRAKEKPWEWVLPKGHVEGGEVLEHCAIREVREESGVWGRITHDLGPVDYLVEDKPIKVQFYLMERIDEDEPDEPSRDPTWLPLVGDDGAVIRATHEESKSVLNIAEAKLKSGTGQPASSLK